MTAALSALDLAARLEKEFPGAILESDDDSLLVNNEKLSDIASFLKNTPGLDFDYLTNLTAVDYNEHFELIYHLVSISHNHSLTLKTRCYDREKPTVPSLVALWRAADLQEREVFDLFGIVFNGHPNLKRIFLWEGFPGYPLRKDFGNDA
jgi:NADH-quinone oxidoreductase subunit C